MSSMACPRCLKPLRTDLQAGSYIHLCGAEFTITDPHPDADFCTQCRRKRIHHVADMIDSDGPGICFDFEPDLSERELLHGPSATD